MSLTRRDSFGAALTALFPPRSIRLSANVGEAGVTPTSSSLAHVNVVTAFGVDNTGATDCGPSITAALAALASTGQAAWFPAGTYYVASNVTNPGATAMRLGQGAVFTGSYGTAATTAALGSFVLSEMPGNGQPTLQITQAAGENISLWNVKPAVGKESGTPPGPFTVTMQSLLKNTTYDNVMHVGYNYIGAPGWVPTEPSVHLSVESNWEPSPGNQWTEMHLQLYDPTAGYSGYLRPWSCVYQRMESVSPALPLGCLQTNLTFSDGAPGHALSGHGVVGFYESNVGQIGALTSTAFYFSPANYQIIGNNGIELSTWGTGSTKVSAGGAYILLEQSSDIQIAAGGVPALQIQASNVGVATPMGGFVYGPTPFQWRNSAVPLSHAGTTTLSASQFICPTLQLTDSGLTGGATVIFPTTTGPTEWTVDLTGVTFEGQAITLQVGMAKKTVVATSPVVLKVYSDGVGSLYAITYA